MACHKFSNCKREKERERERKKERERERERERENIHKTSYDKIKIILGVSYLPKAKELSQKVS